MSKADLKRQVAAQKIREARKQLDDCEDKTLTDHILIFGLAVIEEAISHTVNDD